MKKLIFLCSLFFVLRSTAQNNIPVSDTLRYFRYKQLYKLPPTTAAHPFIKSAGPSVSTPITHVGSIYKNNDPSLKVYGLEALVLRPLIVVSGQPPGVPLRLYLCNLTNGLPVLPAIDSVLVGILAAAPVQSGVKVSGTFTAGPITMTGDFAVLARCVSQYEGDTVHIFRTAGHTATSTTAPSPAHKFGEGLGVVRNAGIFNKTKNYSHPLFGMGTDYEFCVGPMVSFILQTSQIASETQEGACYSEVYTNTNTSSPELKNRQFNFNEFYRELKPFHPLAAITTSFTADSVLTWDLGNGSAPSYLPLGSDTVHLSFGGGTTCNQMYSSTIKGKYRRSASNIYGASIAAIQTFTSFCVICSDGPPIGIAGTTLLNGLKIFPNPTSDKTTISGFNHGTVFGVYNITGQLISNGYVSSTSFEIDLSAQPKGIYLVRINNMENKPVLIKIVRQ